MCGIAGIVRFDDAPVDQRRLEAMRRHLSTRGPDGSGLAVLPRCGLTHARLSIIDPDGGAQPMGLVREDDHQPMTVVFNGEIYNHRALRKHLERLGHRFRTSHSDTEVLLHGYRQWGRRLPQHLEGMFAAAIWDHEKRELFLFRDRMGKKPLYLWRRPGRDGGELMFASLIATLLVGREPHEPTTPPINRDALVRYLQLGYTFTASLVDGVEELPPASWMHVDADGRAAVEAYWTPPPVSRTNTVTGVDEAVRDMLDGAVRRRMDADVPVGCFLSGGIDSSTIAAMAQRHLREVDGDALQTFCVAMPDSDYDESEYAQAVADHIGARHTRMEIRPGQTLFEDLALLMQRTGEPTADSSILPTLLLCRETRRQVKVALSGEGGDELFGGYDRYRAMRLLDRHDWWLRKLPQRVLKGGDQRAMSSRVRRLLAAAGEKSPADQYRRLIQLFTDHAVRDLGPDLPPPRDPMDGWLAKAQPAKAAMRWDLEHYLPFDLLRKMDRASMAVGLEVRCPMLDRQLTELASHLPAEVLMPYGRPKRVLRRIAADLLPHAIVNRPKRGFALPIGRWFAAELRQPLSDILGSGELETVGLSAKAVRSLVDEHAAGRVDHTHRLFALVSLATWLSQLGNQTPAAFAADRAGSPSSVDGAP